MGGALKTTKKTRISEEIVRQIFQFVKDGALKPGDRLPPEREMAQRFGVSRASVREAIRLLDTKGLVVIHPGAGMFVAEDAIETIIQAFASILSDESAATRDVFEMRLLLEPQIASLAAERAGAADIRRMRDIVLAQEAAIAGGATGVESDAELHSAIADATKNSALVAVTEAVSVILARSREDSLMSPERSCLSLESHRAILAAIEQGRADQARKAMHRHIVEIDQEVQAQS